MKPEYHEGPKAAENFERFTKAVFQAPKSVILKETAQGET
jgi:hypothetical protein